MAAVMWLIIEARSPWSTSSVGSQTNDTVGNAAATPGFFAMLGVHPLFGREGGGPARERTVWSRFAADLNLAGQLAREAGLGLGYHNHNWEFFRLHADAPETGYDVLVGETEPELVHELAPKIVESTKAVNQLFDSLFDLARLDSGKVRLNSSRVSSKK